MDKTSQIFIYPVYKVHTHVKKIFYVYFTIHTMKYICVCKLTFFLVVVYIVMAYKSFDFYSYYLTFCEPCTK